MDTCMFCHEAVAGNGPEYIDHVEGRPACKDGFSAWTENMQSDWQG